MGFKATKCSKCEAHRLMLHEVIVEKETLREKLAESKGHERGADSWLDIERKKTRVLSALVEQLKKEKYDAAVTFRKALEGTTDGNL